MWTYFTCLTFSILQRAIGVAAVAENSAKEAECVRIAAVEEREAAVHEVKSIRETMEVTKCGAVLRGVSGNEMILATYMVF